MPNVIDLFAGAGGLSLGAARAGFKVVTAVENDKYAIETHTKNFPGTKHLNADITTLKGSDLLEKSNLKKGDLTGLIGGPPCQGFSSIGKQSLDDNRNDLFTHFFRLVAETQPQFFLAENVPGILLHRYDDLRDQAFKLLGDSYEWLNPIKIVASDYGAPTTRKRIFFIGFKKGASDSLSETAFAPRKDMESVYVGRALNGLPVEISPDWQTEDASWQPVETLGDTYYETRMRAFIPEGIGESSSIERYEKRKEVSGCLGTVHSDKVAQRYANLKPGEKDKVSKAVKLKEQGFCPTLRAGTASDKGSYQAVRPIHYSTARVITPREAARLQGFPDWFVFHPTKWHSFRQIGNSVSPLVSEYLLAAIRSHLEG